MSWFLYMLQCRGGSLYTGITTDVARRYAAHAAGKGARYTRLHPPERIALVLAFDDKSAALKAEYAVKQLSPAQKRALCAAHGTPDDTTPEPPPLSPPPRHTSRRWRPWKKNDISLQFLTM